MATTPRPRFPALPPGLVRRSDEHVVAGVCAGVARWLGVDPIVVRLATLILALANGVANAAALAIPSKNASGPDPDETRTRPAFLPTVRVAARVVGRLPTVVLLRERARGVDVVDPEDVALDGEADSASASNSPASLPGSSCRTMRITR